MSGTQGTGQVFGIAEIYWGGTYIPPEPGASIKLGGLVNKRVVAGAQVFFAREMVPSEVDFTTVLQAGQSLTGTFGTEPAEVQVHCDSGQIYVLPVGFREGDISFTSGEGGKVKVKFAGGAMQESVETVVAAAS